VKYPVLILAAAACIAATPNLQSQPTPPPSPPPLNDTAAPAASPAAATTASPDASQPLATPTPNLDTIFGGPHASQGGKGKEPAAHATPTPLPQRKGLDGVWEIQIQRGPNTDYEHMKLLQTGTSLTGTYLTADKKKYPITGSVDDQNNIRLVVSLPDGTTILLEGRVDGTTDMLGMFTDPKERVPFTAAYRPKENFLENVNASPGGLGTGSGGPGGPGGPQL
jgi:hypothetical protein